MNNNHNMHSDNISQAQKIFLRKEFTIFLLPSIYIIISSLFDEI